MKRAKTLLRNGNMTIENISYSIGYPNAEHFSRVFIDQEEKLWKMTIWIRFELNYSVKMYIISLAYYVWNCPHYII